jgi:DNA-directed RNA polymerase subunit beta'
MLASHNILNLQMVHQLHVPSQDMVLGLYYDQRAFVNSEQKILGQDLTFYSAEEVNIALNEGRLELNAR